uniref:Integral membrane protein 2 n=1 Tax=Serinus canaria TaxID=9135 RepID=A0A8C9NPX8_SERCA
MTVGGCVVALPGLCCTPQLPRESVFHCGVLYEDSLYSPFKGQLELHEDVKIYIEENYEQINVPVPQFGGSDPADIIHDFQRGLTAYHDITLDKCYVIELNTTIVMPPRNLWELLVNVKVQLQPCCFCMLSLSGLLGASFILHRCDSSVTRPASVSDIKGWRDAPSCRSRRLEVTQLNDGPCTSLAEHKMLRALAC